MYLIFYSSLFHSKPVWLAKPKRSFEKCFGPNWLSLYYQNIFFCVPQKVIQVWNNMRVSKLRHFSFSKLNLAAKQQWERNHPVLYLHIPTLSFISHAMSGVCRLCWEQTSLLWRPYNDCLNRTQQMLFSASCSPPTAPTPELSDAKR